MDIKWLVLSALILGLSSNATEVTAWKRVPVSVESAQVEMGRDTAIIVMDPWADFREDVIEEGIVPVMRLAQKRGMRVIILTNEPPLGSPLSKLLYFDKVDVLYHQCITAREFGEYLEKRHISKLIYTGFNSNGCVLSRPCGMLNMRKLRFDMYFIPEASAALEIDNTEDIHKAITMTISQWVGSVIDIGEFLGTYDAYLPEPYR